MKPERDDRKKLQIILHLNEQMLSEIRAMRADKKATLLHLQSMQDLIKRTDSASTRRGET